MTAYNLAILLREVFSEVYWNIETIEKGKVKSPRFWNGSEFEYVGFNKSKCDLAYIRPLSDIKPKPVDIGGCACEYDLEHSFRIVYYVNKPGCGANKNYYKMRLLSLLTDKAIKVERIIDNSNRLFKMEQSKDITIMGDVIYQAFDIKVLEEFDHCCPEEIDTCNEPEKCCLC